MSEPVKKKESVLALIVTLTLIASIAAGVLAFFDYITQKPRREAEIRQTVNALKQLQPALDNDPAENKIYVVNTTKTNDLARAKWEILPKGQSPAAYGVHAVTLYPARKDGKLLSVIAQGISPIGYGGDMTVMAAIKPETGAIENVMVTQNNETPGLGTQVIDRTRQKTIWGIVEGEYKDDANKLPPNRILDYFNGKIFAPDAKDTGKLTASPDVIPASKWKVKKDGGDFLYVTGATISSRAVTYGVKKLAEAYYDTKAAVLKTLGEKSEKNEASSKR